MTGTESSIPAGREQTPVRPSRDTASLGRYGEELAVRYLREQGMEAIERNWRCAHGEVDVVARDGDSLVICEVKTRRPSGFGAPVEAVTFAKVMRLRRLAGAYVSAHPSASGGSASTSSASSAGRAAAGGAARAGIGS